MIQKDIPQRWHGFYVSFAENVIICAFSCNSDCEFLSHPKVVLESMVECSAALRYLSFSHLFVMVVTVAISLGSPDMSPYSFQEPAPATPPSCCAAEPQWSCLLEVYTFSPCQGTALLPLGLFFPFPSPIIRASRHCSEPRFFKPVPSSSFLNGPFPSPSLLPPQPPLVLTSGVLSAWLEGSPSFKWSFMTLLCLDEMIKFIVSFIYLVCLIVNLFGEQIKRFLKNDFSITLF